MTRSLPALVLIIALGSADAGAAVADRCKLPRRTSTVVKTAYAHVYTDDTSFNGSTYACVRKTGRRFELDDPASEVVFQTAENGGPPPQLSGRRLVYALQTFEFDDEFHQLVLLDMPAAKKRRLDGWADDLGEFLGDFRLRRGAVAWSINRISQLFAEGVGEIWLYGRDGKQRLDSGTDLFPHSFAVSAGGERFYWTNGDQPRSALLR